MNMTNQTSALAATLVNNHAKFTSFAWSGAPSDAHNWCIVYTNNRDSNALDRSNAHVIDKTLAAFDEDTVIHQHHGHWACGWIDGYAIQVYTLEGNVTPAFEAYATLARCLEDYPILDESHFSTLEYEEACFTWQTCLSQAERLTYMRDHHSTMHYVSFQDMLAQARGNYFSGEPSTLLNP